MMTKNFQEKKKGPICHKCVKIGRFANNYWIRAKINELQLDESIKEQIKEKLLIHSEGEENSDPYESSEEEQDPKFINSYLRNQVMNLTTSQKKNKSVIISKLFLV